MGFDSGERRRISHAPTTFLNGSCDRTALLDGGIFRIEGLSEELDGAGSGIEQAGETADGGALAGAVGPQESEDAPRAHGEREILDGGHGAVALHEVGNPYGVHQPFPSSKTKIGRASCRERG